MRHAAITTGLAFLLAACAALPPADLPATWNAIRNERDADVLVAMTWNVNYAVGAGPEVHEALLAVRPDVVLLQETTPEFERWALTHLRGPYPHMRFADGRPPAGGMAVLSRFPLEAVEILPSAVGMFPALRGVVVTPRGPVQLLNVHLHPPIHRGSVVAGVLSTGDERLAEMVAHVEALDPSLPTLIGGDFNEGRGGALRLIETRGYRNALVETAPGTATWAWGVGPARMRQALDHIYYGPGLALDDAFALEAGESDHFPVVAVLRLRATDAVASDATPRHAAARHAASRAASSSYRNTLPR